MGQIQRKIQELKKQRDIVQKYIIAQEQIDILKKKRDANRASLDELNKNLDEVVETISVSEALLRIQEITGVMVGFPFLILIGS